MYFLFGPSGVWAMYIPWNSPSLRFVILSPVAGTSSLPLISLLARRLMLQPNCVECARALSDDRALTGRSSPAWCPPDPQVPVDSMLPDASAAVVLLCLPVNICP